MRANASDRCARRGKRDRKVLQPAIALRWCHHGGNHRLARSFALEESVRRRALKRACHDHRVLGICGLGLDSGHRNANFQCAACHSRGGIRGVNSYTQTGVVRPTSVLGLFPVSGADVRARSAEWKTGLKDWAEMTKLAGW